MSGVLRVVLGALVTTRASAILETSIVNGLGRPVEPPLGAYPFQAGLMENKRGYHTFCGGSLIHPQWVLTAAHCIQLDSSSPAIKPSELFVSLGTIYRNGKGGQIIKAAQVKIHQSYLQTGNHDIGLVKLNKQATLGRNVKLVKLFTNNKQQLMGTTVALTGFGIINDFYQEAEKLRKATLHINSFDKCFNTKQSEKTEICATSTIAEGKACKGDSGSPLTMKRNGKTYQVGITSHLALLPICRVSINNSVYTRVSAYITWITTTTGVNFTSYNT